MKFALFSSKTCLEIWKVGFWNFLTEFFGWAIFRRHFKQPWILWRHIIYPDKLVKLDPSTTLFTWRELILRRYGPKNRTSAPLECDKFVRCAPLFLHAHTSPFLSSVFNLSPPKSSALCLERSVVFVKITSSSSNDSSKNFHGKRQKAVCPTAKRWVSKLGFNLFRSRRSLIGC